MPQYLYQVAYTPESLAAQTKNPQDRLEVVGKQIDEAVGAKIIAGGYAYGEYDVAVIVEAERLVGEDVEDGLHGVDEPAFHQRDDHVVAVVGHRDAHGTGLPALFERLQLVHPVAVVTQPW